MWSIPNIFKTFSLLHFIGGSWSLRQGSLELTNDGPVYFKSPIRFTARLTGVPDRLYTFHFFAKAHGTAFNKELFGGREVQLSGYFSTPGDYVLNVKVTYSEWFLVKTIATGKMKFQITDGIPARLVLVQNTTTLADPGPDGISEVSSALLLNASAVINDPSDYFKNTKLQLYWKVKDGIGVINNSFFGMFPSVPGRDKDELDLTIKAFTLNNSLVATGLVSRTIVARDPLTTLNITGELWLRRGQLTQLSFACNASTPIFYCFEWDLTPTNETDFNCTQFHRSDRCAFDAVHYFAQTGDHQIRIAVRNIVNEILSTTSLFRRYRIHVYNVPSKGVLHLAIVPISCIIAGTIVIVSAVALYKHTKGDMRVEVADFDFAGNSTSYDSDDATQMALEERTFWSHLRDELAECSPLLGWVGRSRLRTYASLDDNSVEGSTQPISGPGSYNSESNRT